MELFQQSSYWERVESTRVGSRFGEGHPCPMGSAGLRDGVASAGAAELEISTAEPKNPPPKKAKSKKKKANAYLSPKETHSAQEAGLGRTERKCGEFAIYTNYRSVFRSWSLSLP